MTRLLVVGLCFLLLSVAGCSGKKPEATTSPSPTDSMSASNSGSESASRTSSGGPEPAGNTTAEIILNDCTSWRIVRQFVGTPSPGSPPPGWQPADPSALITGIEVHGIRCNRVSVGPFERPLQLVLEMHTNVTYPESCLEGADPFAVPAVLQSLWVDDPTVAQYFALTFGMPVHAATFTPMDTGAQGVAAYSVSWGESGQPASMMTTLDDTADVSGALLPYRLAWAIGNQVRFLDLTTSMDSPLMNQRASAGQFQEPMLLAAVDGGNYAGSGSWYTNYQAAATVHLFGDLFCKDPL